MAQHPDVQYVQFYTQGNAARKVEPLVPLKTVKLPKARKRKRLCVAIDPISLAAVVMCAVMLILMAVGLFQLHAARENTARMAEYVEALQEQNEALCAELEAEVDLEEVEKTALALGMIPEAQADRVALPVTPQTTEEKPDAWEWLYTFLSGLFA